jgi:SAM-dependent methyltransferase
MASHSTSRPKTWTEQVSGTWRDRIWDPLRGRARCSRLAALLDDPALAGRPVQDDLDHMLRSIARRRLSPFVMGDHARRQSLTDVFDRGAAQAARLRPYLHADDTLLEYGGGIGRIGHAVAPHVRRLVSVDVDPLMTIYGPRLCPQIEFFDRDEVPPEPVFDGAYAVAAFLRLPLSQQQSALEYVHRRLKPGGWFLIDLKLGAQTTEPAGDDDVRSTALADFTAISEPLFSAKRVPLFNAGFLLRKRDADAVPATPVEGRYAVNDASVVADVLEGEVVVVHLDTGAYYILQGTASGVWQMLAAGRPVPAIVSQLAERFPDDAAMASSVADFVAQLTGEGLLVPASSADDTPPLPGDDQWIADIASFTTPVMFRYTDMQALIQMDPIREYDETGWPARRPPQPPVPRPER